MNPAGSLTRRIFIFYAMITINDDTRKFIETHRNDDVRQLALSSKRDSAVNMTFALSQIAGWQTARTKLPEWAEKPHIIYPPHLSMEQCSSAATAYYKVSVVKRLLSDGVMSAHSMLDLTGGFGVDFSYLSRQFDAFTYVEMQQHLCDIAQHNFSELGLTGAKVICGNGESVLETIKPQDFIYLDPARRDANGGRTYDIEDCTPNVIALNDLLLQKANVVMVKLSPMLDWRKAISELHGVSEVHIVSVDNECKELLLVLTRQETAEDDIRVYCVNNDQMLSFTLGEEKLASVMLAEEITDADLQENLYLIEPNASVMKAGCFSLLCEKFGISKIGKNSNLFLSHDETDGFPGRRFLVTAISSMNKKELRKILDGIASANIAVRNFPLTAQELRKRLKLKDGGNHYIFGTTDSSDRHILLLCKKV